jgi:hypothetical protein
MLGIVIGRFTESSSKRTGTVEVRWVEGDSLQAIMHFSMEMGILIVT